MPWSALRAWWVIGRYWYAIFVSGGLSTAYFVYSQSTWETVFWYRVAISATPIFGLAAFVFLVLPILESISLSNAIRSGYPPEVPRIFTEIVLEFENYYLTHPGDSVAPQADIIGPIRSRLNLREQDFSDYLLVTLARYSRSREKGKGK